MPTLLFVRKLLKKIKNFILNLNFYFYIKPKFRTGDLKSEYIFITGADSTHYKSALNCIKSIISKHQKIVFWDLGCTDKELAAIGATGITIRKFPYKDFPDFLNIKINAGNYAWKPIIIELTADEFKIPVFWFDAGNLLIDHKKILMTTMVNVFYSPYSIKKVCDLTHPSVIKKFSEIKGIHKKNNLNGACVCFDPKNSKAINLLRDWSFYAKDINYIAPEGSSRLNHRQDQSLLTLLAYKYDLVKKIPHGYLDFSIHNDVD